MTVGPWMRSSSDPALSGAVQPGSPARTHAGADLDLHMGWDRFEKLVLLLSQSILGLRGVQMRRYGVVGQSQHGIDLAGREADHRYTVIQCKEYQNFEPSDLRVAVEKFASGIRPFDAYRFIVATSHSVQSTQIADELQILQDEHLNDFEIDLWGAEQLNDHLRSQASIVARFWTRETADDFCTSAPLAGLPAPPPDKQQQAEQILLGPLNTNDVVTTLRSAEAKRESHPDEAAGLYGSLAVRLDNSGFRGHASALRHKQLGALRAAQQIDEAADLAASLAISALQLGDRLEARELGKILEEFAVEAQSKETSRAASTQLQTDLVEAAINACHRVTGQPEPLLSVIRTSGTDKLECFASLVLLLAEDMLATDPHRTGSLADLIDVAIASTSTQPTLGAKLDLSIRLRLVKAEFDESERILLAKEARRHQLPQRQASLVSAREARRCALEGGAEEAQENWRDAIQDAIHSGLPYSAAEYLYAIRALNARYGPWTSALDDEHRLAQALKTAGGGRLIERIRDPREQAMSALVGQKPVEAVISSRQWLIDSVVSGAWQSEGEAIEFLGDLYRDNREPREAAKLYQRAGASKKLGGLAVKAGNTLLPIGPLEGEPWWVLRARANLISAQEDLLDDSQLRLYIDQLLSLSLQGRVGAIIDSPTQDLFHQATRTVCDLVHRGTADQAKGVLESLAVDVQRAVNHHRLTDDAHAEMCLRLAEHQPEMAMSALARLFDLAQCGARPALNLIADDRVLHLLGKPEEGVEEHASPLSPQQIADFYDRVVMLAENDQYLAAAALVSLQPHHEVVITRAKQAMDRIPMREEPNPTSTSLGTAMVTDSYLVSCCLSTEEQYQCLEKLLAVAKDTREPASNRQEALVGVRNLVISQPPARKHQVFEESKSFVLGELDGSHLDEWTGEPHPLSTFKINLGSGSLRGSGLRLAVASAEMLEDQTWVRDQAGALLSSEEKADVQAAAVALNQLPSAAVDDFDANLLVGHSNVNVRQLCAVLSMRQPDRFHRVALTLCEDPDQRVRITLAGAARRSPLPQSPAVRQSIEKLTADARHSVRFAANGSGVTE